jgi:hypothetical protein
MYVPVVAVLAPSVNVLFAAVIWMGQNPCLWGWEKWPRHGSAYTGGIPEQ